MTKQDLIQFLDYTTLNEKETGITVSKFIESLLAIGCIPASVCTYSSFGHVLTGKLKSVGISSCVVACAFPNGNQTLESKIEELILLNSSHIDEVDIVLPYDALSDFNKSVNELQLLRNAIPNKVLKVIIESGHLSKLEIKLATQICLAASVDFVKTSTGKIEIGATLDAADIISKELFSHFQKTGKRVGIKVSGGIRTYEQAIKYVNLIESNLSKEWLTPKLFRIGASSLLNNLLE